MLIQIEQIEDLSGILGTSNPDNIPVTATFTAMSSSPVADEYDGVGEITQISYDTNVIYLVVFDQNNTGPARLNIDGLGYLDILKGDDTLGLVTLDPNDIVATIVYYIVYDGTQFQIFELAPTQEPNTYTNLNPSTTTVGGVSAGTTFNSMTYKDLFDMMFYPYVLSNFSTFTIVGQSASLEVGESISSGNKTFTWNTTIPANVVANSIKIQQNTTSSSWLITNTANDNSEVISFPSSIVRTTPGTYNWKVYAQRTNSSWFNRTFTVNWFWKIYYGTSANEFLVEAEVKALTTNQKAANRLGTYTFGTGDYKYFAIPDSFGEVIAFKDFTTNLNVAMAGIAEGYTSGGTNGLYYQNVSVTNSYGITTNYRVYRTRNILGGTIKIIVT